MGFFKALGCIAAGVAAVVAAPVVIGAAAAAGTAALGAAAAAGTAAAGAAAAAGTAVAGAAAAAGTAVAGTAVGGAAIAAGSAAAGAAAAAGTAVAGAAAAAGTAVAGAAAAAGTAVAGSAVGSAAIAAGSAAAGAVTAAGSAVAGAAAAAGTAVAGAATAAGTAVAGSAVGTAVAGAATTAAGAVTAAGTAVAGAATSAAATVGAAYGTAAGAVGLSSAVAATGTTAGAAAFGTVSSSIAAGLYQGLSAKEKLDKAEEIVNSAKYRFEQEDSKFKNDEKKINAKLKSMANVKKRVAEKLTDLNNLLEKLENPSRLQIIKVSIADFGVDTRMNFEGYGIPVQDWAKGVAASYASGNFLGVALTGSITSTITTAGTGAAMSSLSGAAATNATLAALGGGTVASGGMGMAGGALMAKGLVFAPAFAIGGFLVNNKADEALEEAGKIDSKANEAVVKLKEIRDYYAQLGSLVSAMQKNILETENVFSRFFTQLQVVANRQLDVEQWTEDQVNVAFAAISLSKVLELQCKTNFIKQGAEIEKLDKNDLISESNVKKLAYTNNPVVLEGIGTPTELVEKADKANIYA